MCLCFRAEQREVCTQPAALLAVGFVYAALRWPPHGLESTHPIVPAVPTPRDDLEAYTCELLHVLLAAMRRVAYLLGVVFRIFARWLFSQICWLSCVRSPVAVTMPDSVLADNM